MNITEDYVSFETAKLLKEKVFPQDPNMCNTAYTTKGKFSNNAKSFVFYYESIKPRAYYNAPTLQMAMKWLREVHKLYIEITPSSKTNEFIVDSYRIDIVTRFFDTIYVSSGYSTYEEACEVAIKYCLENLI